MANFLKELIASSILGVVGAYLIQLFKTRISVTGRKALALALTVSAVAALAVSYWIGGFGLFDFVFNIAVVFGVATVAHRMFIARNV